MMEQQNIINRLDRIEKAIEEIRETLVDPDAILTEEERKLLDQSIINQREGKLVSLEEIKNARNSSR